MDIPNTATPMEGQSPQETPPSQAQETIPGQLELGAEESVPPQFQGKTLEEMAEINRNAQRKITELGQKNAELAQQLELLRRQVEEMRSYTPPSPPQPAETPEEMAERLRRERLEMLENPLQYRQKIKQELMAELQGTIAPLRWNQQKSALRQAVGSISDSDFALLDQQAQTILASHPYLKNDPNGYEKAFKMAIGEVVMRASGTYQTTPKPMVETPGPAPEPKRYSAEAEYLAKMRGTKPEDEQKFLDQVMGKKRLYFE